MRDAVGSVDSVLVLGGRSEIGLATARRLAADGARSVVLAVRDSDRGAETAELEDAGARVELMEFDADRLDTHEQFASEVFSRVGDIDLVLLAFGVLGDQAQAARDRTTATSIVQTNFAAAVSVLIPVVQALRRQGHGTLVVLSSVAAERPRRSNFVYGASKVGLDAFAHGLGDSLQAEGAGVSVMVVRPGFVRTRMTAGLEPAPLSTDPDTVAEEIAAGLRRGARTVWVPPILRWVMAILRHLPAPLFRRLDL